MKNFLNWLGIAKRDPEHEQMVAAWAELEQADSVEALSGPVDPQVAVETPFERRLRRKLIMREMLKDQMLNEKTYLWGGALILGAGMFRLTAYMGNWPLTFGLLSIGFALLGLWCFELEITVLGYLFFAIAGSTGFAAIVEWAYAMWGIQI